MILGNEPLAHRATVLVIDDEPTNLQILGGALDKCGYAIQLASLAKEAMSVIEQQPPDLILLDVMMPEMDGFAFCRQLKAMPEYRSIPVIFVTANTDHKAQLEGFEAGGVDYISKPIRVSEVLARVEAQLALVEARLQIKADLEQQSALLQIVCQDLKAPLTLVESQVQRCEQMRDQESAEVTMLGLMNATQHGLALIDLVQAFSMDSSFELTLVDVPLDEAIDDAVEIHGESWRTKNIMIRKHIAPNLRVRAEYVSLVNCVLGALLSNAIKYSAIGAELVLEAEQSETEAVLRFIDSGIGMPVDTKANELLSISNQGRRCGTAGETGAGFGLFLAQRFISIFGGRLVLEARSDDQPGSCVSLFLPLSSYCENC